MHESRQWVAGSGITDAYCETLIIAYLILDMPKSCHGLWMITIPNACHWTLITCYCIILRAMHKSPMLSQRLTSVISCICCHIVSYNALTPLFRILPHAIQQIVLHRLDLGATSFLFSHSLSEKSRSVSCKVRLILNSRCTYWHVTKHISFGLDKKQLCRSAIFPCEQDNIIDTALIPRFCAVRLMREIVLLK